MRNKNVVLGLLLSAAALLQNARAEAPPTGKLPDDVRPLAYALHLKIDPHADRFSGEVRIRLRLTKPTDHLWLHASEIQISKMVLIDASGKTHEATLTQRDPSGVAEVAIGGVIAAQDAELAIEYNAAFNAKLQGLYKVQVGHDPYAVTQMEPTAARYAFPCFDEPRFKTPFDITLQVPKDLVGVANTLQISEQLSADGKWKTLKFARTRPLPTYLVAYAVGPWDVVAGPVIPANAVRKEPVQLRAIGPRGTGPQFRWVLEQTPAVVKYFELYTQQPYPFGKLDLLGAPDFSAGAMENAGLIVYRDALLRTDDKSSARTYRTIFDVNAHEIAHQWFGDLVTVPWWDDIWLNESFATWAQGKATVDLKPEYRGDLARLEGTLDAMQSDSLLSARQIRQPILSNGDIETAFDGITYQKGAAVLRMFEQWLGETTYRAAMRDYLARHAFGSGDSNALIDTIAKVSGKGATLKEAMRSFLDQPGIPLVHAALHCENTRATLSLSQSRYLPFGVNAQEARQWTLPVCVRFDRGGRSARQCFLLDRRERSFKVAGGCADSYLPNADAAGYYRFTMPDADAAALRKRVSALSPAEQIIYADDVSSAFNQGTLTPGALLDTMPSTSTSDLPQVAGALFGQFDWIRRYLATDATRPALDAFAARLYAPRLSALGLDKRPADSDTVTQLRSRLIRFLAQVAHDKSVRRSLNDKAAIALGLDGSGVVDLARIDPDLRSAALRVAVQDAGEPAFNAVLRELQTNRQTAERYELLAALGSTHDPALGEKLRNYGLTSAVAVGEMPYLYFSHAGESENIGPTWRWLQTHYDAMAGRVPDQAQSEIISLAAAGRCSRAESEELRAWFAPRIKSIIGGERILAQSLETIDQCAALREHFASQSLARE